MAMDVCWAWEPLPKQSMIVNLFSQFAWFSLNDMFEADSFFHENTFI
jgi:hypothetical protein